MPKAAELKAKTAAQVKAQRTGDQHEDEGAKGVGDAPVEPVMRRDVGMPVRLRGHGVDARGQPRGSHVRHDRS
jgi:hypothetical protein